MQDLHLAGGVGAALRVSQDACNPLGIVDGVGQVRADADDQGVAVGEGGAHGRSPGELRA
ncbi:MAG: hypothetical protein V9H69_06085 [Anaerolineae bacterium]